MFNIKKILRSKKPKVRNTIFIAVDGNGGSGKSTLSDWLSKKFNAEIIHTDDFASWDNPLDWWSLVLERVFKPIETGAETLSYPRSQWWEGQVREPIVGQPVTKIMILEGVSSLRKEFRDYISLGFFVDTSKEICLQRGIQRDLENGKSENEVKKMWESWFEKEEEYFERDKPKAYADLVVDGIRPFEDQIE